MQKAKAHGRLSDKLGNWFLTSEGAAKQLKMNPEISKTFHKGDIVEVVGEQKYDAFYVHEFKILVSSQGENPFSNREDFFSVAKNWSDFCDQIKIFFSDRGFTSLRTPTLVPSPGLEPFLDPFKTEFKVGRETREFFLPTSPEFHLKKALTLGFEKIFEFKECFRNGELTDTHQPEFLMLEWYRAYEDIHSLVKDVNELFKALQKKFSKNICEVEIYKMEDLWKDAVGFDLKPNSTIEDLKLCAKKCGLDHHESDFDDLFHLLFLEKIEPFLAKKNSPIVVWHYPPSQAALAKLTPEGWADRFEVYWKGFEIANAFHELNDVTEQRKRFLQDQEKKKKLNKEVVPLDVEFLKALAWGMPPSSGIALGMERLFMALFDINKIEECRLFPMKRD